MGQTNLGVWQLNNRKIPCRPHKTCFFYIKFFVFMYVIFLSMCGIIKERRDWLWIFIYQNLKMQIHKICRKLKQKYKFKYDINAIFSDLIYARILDPCSKLSSYKVASEFLEKPSYEQQKIKKRRKRVGIKHKKI